MAQVPELKEWMIKLIDRWYQFPQFCTGLQAMNSKGRRTLQAVNDVRLVDIKEIHLLAGPVGCEKMTIMFGRVTKNEMVATQSIGMYTNIILDIALESTANKYAHFSTPKMKGHFKTLNTLTWVFLERY